MGQGYPRKYFKKWGFVHETIHDGVGGKSVRQADVSGGTHFPRKFCPTGQDILSASRIICPGLGGKSVRQENVSRPDPIISLA